MRYRIDTWCDSNNVHYTDWITIEQVEANLHRSGAEVRLAVLSDLRRRHIDTYLDFDQRTFVVQILDN